MDDHPIAPEIRPMSQETRGNAHELIRDWELLFWGFLLFGVARLAWLYLHRPDINAFQLGVSCGVVFCGILGFLMRWVLSPRTNGHRGIGTMEKTVRWKLTLSQVETFVFFAAMLVAIALEGACVYWLGSIGLKPTPAGIQSPNLVGQWTAVTLPQCWLLGALLVLLYRVSAMLIPPLSWGRAEAESNRRAFLRLWCWTVALGAFQVGAVYLDRITMVVH